MAESFFRAPHTEVLGRRVLEDVRGDIRPLPITRLVQRNRGEASQYQHTLRQYGIDSPELSRLLAETDIEGRTLNTAKRTPRPTIEFMAEFNNKTYILNLFEASENLSFTNSVKWNKTEILGRSSEIHTYRSSSATSFTVAGTILVHSPEDAFKWEKYMNIVRAMKLPTRNVESGVTVSVLPPLSWSLIISNSELSDHVYDGRVRIEEVNWEFLRPYVGGYISKSGVEVPAVPQVTAVTINVSEDEGNLSIDRRSKDEFFDQVAKPNSRSTQSDLSRRSEPDGRTFLSDPYDFSSNLSLSNIVRNTNGQ